MAEQQPAGSAPASNQEAVQKYTEYVPYGAKDAIKLNIGFIKRFIAVPTKTGKLCTDDDAVKFIMLCQARKLNPYEGDAFLIGYDTQNGPKFNLITAHQAFLKRAELSDDYDGMESGVIIATDKGVVEREGDFHFKDEKIVGGWAKVHFKNRSKPMYKRVRLERFAKTFGVWLDDPAGMIVKCAEADALRSSFPTMCGGLYLKEELEPKPEPPKVNAPLFGTPEAPSAPEAAAPSETPTDILNSLMNEMEIKELDLLTLTKGIGMVDDKYASMNEVPDDQKTNIIKNISHLAERIQKGK